MPASAAPVTYQERKERGICTRPGCRRRAAGESSMCIRHWRADRRAQRGYKQRERDQRRADGMCIWCPKTRINKATPGGTSCLRCRIDRNRIRTSDGGGQRVVHPDDRAARIAAATRKDPDGRTRYFGQQKRGQQPKEQLIAQDLRYMRDCLDAAVAGYRELHSAEVAAMPRIQREDIGRAADHQIARVLGHGEELLERRGHWKVRHGPRDES